jgi:hypothetical protein
MAEICVWKKQNKEIVTRFDRETTGMYDKYTCISYSYCKYLNVLILGEGFFVPIFQYSWHARTRSFNCIRWCYVWKERYIKGEECGIFIVLFGFVLKNVDILFHAHDTFSVKTFIRYAPNQTMGRPYNLIVFWEQGSQSVIACFTENSDHHCLVIVYIWLVL